MRRLSTVALADVRPGDVPPYPRPAPAPFVHLGLGAFAQAHLGVYADDLLRAGHPAAIRAVSLRRRRAQEQLEPQDGLYTVTTREPSAPPSLRVVGSVRSVETGAAAAVRAIADPATRFVSLTVTEKAYEGSGPGSVAAVLAAGLEARRRAGAGAVVVASLDNLLDNGAVLRPLVLAAADEGPPGSSGWVDRHVAFPCSVVDRMVPATTAADRAQVAQALGLVDEAAVLGEAHRSWVVEAVDGLPPLADVGVVPDVGPRQQRKLWLLNGPHSAFAYGGLLAGHETIAQATADPRVSAFVAQLVDDVLAVVDADAAGRGAVAYAAAARRRFGNPALGHTCRQVGADGSRKLAQRLLPVVAARRSQGLGAERFAVVVAVWLAAVIGIEVAGRPLPALEEPAAEGLRRSWRERGAIGAAEAAVGPSLEPWAPQVASALDRLIVDGPALLGSA